LLKGILKMGGTRHLCARQGLKGWDEAMGSYNKKKGDEPDWAGKRSKGKGGSKAGKEAYANIKD